MAARARTSDLLYANEAIEKSKQATDLSQQVKYLTEAVEILIVHLDEVESDRLNLTLESMRQSMRM